jgi:hypothetical protein
MDIIRRLLAGLPSWEEDVGEFGEQVGKIMESGFQSLLFCILYSRDHSLCYIV